MQQTKFRRANMWNSRSFDIYDTSIHGYSSLNFFLYLSDILECEYFAFTCKIQKFQGITGAYEFRPMQRLNYIDNHFLALLFHMINKNGLEVISSLY